MQLTSCCSYFQLTFLTVFTILFPHFKTPAPNVALPANPIQQYPERGKLRESYITLPPITGKNYELQITGKKHKKGKGQGLKILPQKKSKDLLIKNFHVKWSISNVQTFGKSFKKKCNSPNTIFDYFQYTKHKKQVSCIKFMPFFRTCERALEIHESSQVNCIENKNFYVVYYSTCSQ